MALITWKIYFHFTVFGFIVLHVLMYAAELHFWRHCRVNYPFIFGSKRGTELGCQEVFLLGAGLAGLASASFLASLYLDRDPSTRKYRTEAEKVPLGTTACVHRLLEEKDVMHGYNALKYLSTIVAVLIRTAFELRKGVTWMVLPLISSAIAMLINTYWDIVVDWGLLRKHSKNKYLRDRLLVSNKRVYFAAMLLNLLLRIAWIQLVLAFNLRSFQKVAATTSISCLEIIRRRLWNFFSLENEHLNNVNKYRSFKSGPLPFRYSDDDNEKDD